jgi:hypothetical protein
MILDGARSEKLSVGRKNIELPRGLGLLSMSLYIWILSNRGGDVDPFTFTFNLINYEIIRESSDLFGQIIGGWIRVRALFRCINCVVIRDDRMTVCPIEQSGGREKDGNVIVSLDAPHPPTPEEEEAFWQDAQRIELCAIRFTRSTAIALVPVNDDYETFRRIGLLLLGHKWAGGWKERVVKVI